MIVAVTGIVLILFVIGHLLGNLQIFLGPAWINGYSQHLQDLGPILWVIRAFLLAVVLVHIYYTIQLVLENRRARPERYRRKDIVKATLASRSMAMSGLIVLAFIIFHLLQYYLSRDRSALCHPAEGSIRPLRRIFHDGSWVFESDHLRVLYSFALPACPAPEPWVVEFFPVARPE